MDDEGLSQNARDIAEQKIHPIVEFFSVDAECRSDREFINTKMEDRRSLRSALREAKGVYAFYNSEFEIIYLGKTRRNLWEEMKGAYNRKMNHYARYQVHHARGKYAALASGRARSLQKRPIYLYDCAQYFSAYAIEDDTLIDLIELMMIRLCPNDLLNVRMEGNTTLRAYPG